MSPRHDTRRLLLAIGAIAPVATDSGGVPIHHDDPELDAAAQEAYDIELSWSPALVRGVLASRGWQRGSGRALRPGDPA